MDGRIRRNEKCIIGLPRCDYVFSSTRSCFIAYGFGTSDLEVEVLRGQLKNRGMESVEAGGARAPGENAFCVKICSKIITAQFCILLLNNDVRDGREVPNANVNMEYGLMLGFNKLVIPFQREGQTLPFNVAGLDTIKYTNETFSRLAAEVIEQAIAATTPSGSAPVDINQPLNAYLLSREMTFARIDSDGDRVIFDLGAPLGFNLLIDFSGMNYVLFGNFSHLRPEAVVWRLRMLHRAIDGRRSSWEARVKAGLLTNEQALTIDELFSRFRTWALVNAASDVTAVTAALDLQPSSYSTEVFSFRDVEGALHLLGGALA